jgi:hypothetical protein
MCARAHTRAFLKEDVQMRLSLLPGLLAAAVLGTGCFGVGDIDRTQPDKVKKSLFKNADGSPKEYFYRQTIIDVPATNGVSFIGEQGDTDRVVFHVTEDVLYVYRSYGHLQNTEGGDVDVPGNQGDGYVRPGTGPYQGTPLAAFPIVSHFDVQRQYNASTGEQTNVIVENNSDRPWYDREFMRVNWAGNMIADFRFGGAAALQATIIDYTREADDNPEMQRDRPVITEDYVDVVTNYSVVPEHLDYRMYGYGLLPQCYFYTSIYKDCLGGTIRVRSSFLPVDKLPRYADNDGKSDYVALNYDDLRFEKFGFFRTERPMFDDQYGIVEPAQIRLANRWNIWKDAGSCYNPEADLPYSSCSPDQLRTIVYYLNEDFPREIPELVDTALANADEWDRVFKEAVKATTGWSDADLAGKRLYTICPNNPVQAGDPAECGEEGLNPQIGDLRYSMYYYVANFQDSSPLGYGPSAADPFTGEIIQGNAFYYGQPAATLAQRTLDILKLELGTLSENDIADGLPARQAVTRALEQGKNRVRNGLGNGVGDRARQLAEHLDIKNKARRLNAQIANGEAFIDKREARKQALRTSSLPQRAMTDEIREVFTAHILQSSAPPADLDAAVASALFDEDILFARSKLREEKLLMHPSKSCVLAAEDVFDEGLLGLLRTVRVKFINTSTNPPSLKDGVTEQDVYNFVLGMTMGDTQLHEIGHTVGLRHNFAGSTDALNFGEQYWALRGACDDTGACGLLDDERPIPEWEVGTFGAARDTLDGVLELGLRDHQDSSVMDYASTYGTTNTLGSYDLAAIKYAYGDVVEVFNSADIDADKARLFRQGEMHYRNYPEVVSSADTYLERVASMYDRRNVNFRKVPRLKDAVAGDPIEVPYSFCSDEYRDASATCALWDAGADNFERTEYAIEKYRNYRIFNTFKRERLTFGIDVFGYLSRVYGRDFTYMLNQYKNWVNDELIIRRGEPCQVVRNGAITVESTDRFAADSCGMPGFVGTVATVNLMAEVLASPDVGCYVRLQNGCYDANVGNASQTLAPDEPGIRRVSTDPDFCDTFVPTQPTSDREDRRVALKITDTSPFLHVNNSESCSRVNDRLPFPWQAPEVIDDATDQPITDAFIQRELLDDGVVRASNTLYDRDRYGYYFYIKPTVIGSWWEKWLAVKAIGDGNTDFIGVDASSDTRSFLISLNTIFGDDLNNIIGGAVTDNIGNYAPVMRDDGTVEPLPLLDLRTGGAFDRSIVTDPVIHPDQQYTFRLLAMYNAAYNGQYTDDFEFGESIRIGTAAAVTDDHVDAAVRANPDLYVQVQDPVTKMFYYAVKSVRSQDNEGFYSIGYEYLREIKARYYVGGADGPGTQLLPAYEGTFVFEPRQDLEIAQIMAATASTFGNPDVWSGDLDL